MPVFISDRDNGLGLYGYYGLPIIDVPGVKVSAHHSGHVLTDAAAGRPAAAGGAGGTETDEAAAAERRAAIIAANEQFVADFFPGLEAKPFRNDNCLYTSTSDLDYVLDRVPGFENAVLVGGGSGHAFKMGPAVGAAAAALALGREPPFALDKFRLDRPGLNAGSALPSRP